MGISSLWSAPEVNPINKKARSIPLLNPFNKYGRVFFFAWFGFFIVCFAHSMGLALVVYIKT